MQPDRQLACSQPHIRLVTNTCPQRCIHKLPGPLRPLKGVLDICDLDTMLLVAVLVTALAVLGAAAVGEGFPGQCGEDDGVLLGVLMPIGAPVLPHCVEPGPASRLEIFFSDNLCCSWSMWQVEQVLVLHKGPAAARAQYPMP